MEPERFDELATSVAAGETSRRSVLVRIAGGGFAALLAGLGVGGFGADDAEARKPCKKRCKKKKDKDKRRKCKRRCRKQPSTPGAPGPECTGTGDCPGTDICVDNQCVDRPEEIACTTEEDCAGSSVCVANICVLPCDDDADCDGALICLNSSCVLDNECEDDTDCEDPLLDTCLLGLCVDNIL